MNLAPKNTYKTCKLLMMNDTKRPIFLVTHIKNEMRIKRKLTMFHNSYLLYTI